MEGRYGKYRQRSRTIRNEEFEEEDMWSVLKDTKDHSSKVSATSNEPSIIFPRPIPSSTKLIQHSAPVNIPDWSKIYGKNPKTSKINASWLDDGVMRDSSSWDSDDEEDDDNDHGHGDMMPPHEWIAKKLVSRQISSFSVCEGVGRTLKGWDLSRVRNSILTKTGFLE